MHQYITLVRNYLQLSKRCKIFVILIFFINFKIFVNLLISVLRLLLYQPLDDGIYIDICIHMDIAQRFAASGQKLWRPRGADKYILNQRYILTRTRHVSLAVCPSCHLFHHQRIYITYSLSHEYSLSECTVPEHQRKKSYQIFFFIFFFKRKLIDRKDSDTAEYNFFISLNMWKLCKVLRISLSAEFWVALRMLSMDRWTGRQINIKNDIYTLWGIKYAICKSNKCRDKISMLFYWYVIKFSKTVAYRINMNSYEDENCTLVNFCLFFRFVWCVCKFSSVQELR